MNELSRTLNYYATFGKIKELQQLIADNTFNTQEYTDALISSACSGHTDILKILLPLSDPKLLNSRALTLAAEYKNHGCVKLLLPVSEPSQEIFASIVRNGDKKMLQIFFDAGVTPMKERSFSGRSLLELAFENGDQYIADMLLPYSTIDHINKALPAVVGELQSIGTSKVMDCVQLLLLVADPKHNDSEALQWASIQQSQDIFDVLCPLSDPHAAYQAMLKDGWDGDDLQLIQCEISKRERHEISNNLSEQTTQRVQNRSKI